MRASSLITTLPLLALIACAGGEPKPGETGAPTGPTNTDPTDTEDTEPSYEPGCITVNGGEGYANLQDAITVASDGATIALCGNLEEEVVVSGKAVTIVGEGVDANTWNAPSNAVPLTVREGGSAILRDVSVSSTRSAFLADGAYLELDTVNIVQSGGYGIEALNGTVVARSVEIANAPWGGVRATGGSVELVDSAILGTYTAGVLGEDGADVTVTRTLIRDVEYVDDGSGSISDGFGIWVNGGSTLTTQGNTIINSTLAGIYIEDGTATLTGDTLMTEDAGLMFLGMYIDNSTVNATGLDVSGYYQWGHYAYSADVTYTDSAFATDGAASLASSKGSDGSINTGSMGIVQVDGSVSLINSSSSGNNSAGVWAESTAGDVTVILDGAVLDDNAERGLYIYEGEVDATDTVISNTRNNDAVCVDEATGSQSCNMAMFAIGATTTFVGGEVRDNQGWGLAGLEANVIVNGTTFEGNDFVGIFVQAASTTVQNATFTGWGNFGIYLNTATALVSDSLFLDRNYDSVLENWDGAGGYADYHYQAIDVYAYASDMVVENTTFANSQYALYMSGAQATINDVDFDGTNQPIYMYSASEVEIDGLQADGTGSGVVDCSDSTVTVADAEITNTQPYVYGYEYYYADGSLSFSSTGSGYTAAIDGYRCDLTVEDSELVTTVAESIYGYDTSLELNDVSIRDGGQYASTTAGIELYYSNTATPDAEMTSVEVTGQRLGSGIYVYNTSENRGYVSIANANLGAMSDDGFSGLARHGLYIYGTDTVVDGLDVANSGYTPVYVHDSSYVDPVVTVIGASGDSTGTIQDCANYGVEAWGTDITLIDLTVIDAPLSGMFAQDSTVTTSNFVVTGAGSYGIDCSGTVAFAACDATLDAALGEYGVTCPVCP